MKIEEYEAKLLAGFSQDGYTSQRIRIDVYPCLLFHGVRIGSKGIGYSDIFVNPAKEEVSLHYVKAYSDAIKEYMLQGPMGLLKKIGIATVVGERVSPVSKSYVERNIMRNAWRDVFVPMMLVDLENEDVSATRHPGFIGWLPITRSMSYARRKFSLEGRIKKY